MNQFKKGDQARVRPDLTAGKCGSDYVVSDMLSLRGRIVEIESARSDGKYNLKGFRWNWTSEMLESTDGRLKVGDVVRITDSPDNDHKIGDVGTIIADDGSDCLPYEVSVNGIAKHGVYDEEELELVTKGGDQPMARRTFKQIKDSVTVKKNALWQEACDDGTQEYVLLDESFNKDSQNAQRIYDRSLVEDDPKNFVEVFQVVRDCCTDR